MHKLETLSAVDSFLKPAAASLVEEGFAIYLTDALEVKAVDQFHGTEESATFDPSAYVTKCKALGLTKILLAHTHTGRVPAVLSTTDYMTHHELDSYFRDRGITLVDSVVVTVQSCSSARASRPS